MFLTLKKTGGQVLQKSFFFIAVGALIIQRPLSVMVEEGENITLQCKTGGVPTPIVTWQKAFSRVPKKKTAVENGSLTILKAEKADGGTYACTAKNLLGHETAIAQVTVTDRLKFTLTPPLKCVVLVSCMLMLHCEAQGAIEIDWTRVGKHLSQNHVLYPNGTLLLTNISPNDAGSYRCVAKNSLRSVTATSVIEVNNVTPKSCSNIKLKCSEKPSGNYIIDPDGKGGVAPFSVYCDMSDKGGVGVTVISHNRESRTHVANIPGCNYNNPGCYKKDVTYTGINVAQLAALTRVSQNCEQFIKFECNNDVAFVPESVAWWVSRDGRKMNYWGGADGSANTCACRLTNSCLNGQKCNCYNSGSGWREDSGLLTDKSALPVSQIKLADFDNSGEEGYHTLGKLKCYGLA